MSDKTARAAVKRDPLSVKCTNCGTVGRGLSSCKNCGEFLSMTLSMDIAVTNARHAKAKKKGKP